MRRLGEAGGGGPAATALTRRTFLGAAGLGLFGASFPGATTGHAQPTAAAGIPISEEARRLLAALPGKAVMGARVPPLVTELVDFNAPGWRRSADDMRTLLAGDPGLAYAVVQAPRLDVGSVEAARVALAVLALDPPRFQAFYEALARGEGPIDGVRALNVVRAEGIDHYKVFRASNQPDVTDSLSRAVELVSALRVIDPPAYVIGGQVWTGEVDLARKRALIAAARACGGC
ncbi:DsbA family protein [Xanthobacter dioxanivorans]|uniref:DsbA family protein n=1 Tax=Xanthobacter dioxanivorans TaxID=2528964 RepID=A0A974PQ14_9HYPH|nr:DsbA family protein [Xanthobacter dioxanivorans]QRG07649.1 DsbA family protein [Xanthobacter dioxanivorans]